MLQTDRQLLSFFRGSLLFFGGLTVGSTVQFDRYILESEYYDIYSAVGPVIYFGWAVSIGLGLVLILTWTKYADWLVGQARRFLTWFDRQKRGFHWLAAVFGVVLPLVLIGNQFYCEYKLIRVCGFFSAPMLRFFFLGAGALALFLSLRKIRPEIGEWMGFVFSVLLVGFVLDVVFIFNSVSDYPLSLGWSETSRYYWASLFWAEKVYGFDLPWTVYHPSRYMLQSIPFILPGSSLWLHRLWLALLWFVLTGAAAFVLVGRWLKAGSLRWLIAGLWVYLYLRQGPVRFNLLPSLIILFWGFDKERYWKSMGVVLAASVWAGISGINWIPIPGLIAAVLYYLEAAVNDDRLVSWKYFFRSFLFFVVGSLAGAGAFYGYILLSGNQDVGQFGSAFSSALIWGRLWPTASFKPGVLPGVLMVTLPLLFLGVRRMLKDKKAWHGLRILGIGAVTLVLLIAGLVVSVKIGGGTNLHNLDAYMTVVLLFGGYAVFDRYGREGDGEKSGVQDKPLNLFLGCVMLIPAVWVIYFEPIVKFPSEVEARTAFTQIDTIVGAAVENGQEVLFISERQLVMFDMLAVEVPLVQEYEKITLMEMAMSGNQVYLDAFYQDIREQRFGVIIVNPMQMSLRDVSQDTLAAENNVWVLKVSRPVRCAYENIYTSLEAGVQILVPKEEIRCLYGADLLGIGDD